MVDRYRLRSAICVSATLGYDSERADGCCMTGESGERSGWTPEGAPPLAGNSAVRAPLIFLQPASPPTSESSISRHIPHMTTRVTSPTKSRFSKGVFACFIWTVFINPSIVIGNNLTILNVINRFVQLWNREKINSSIYLNMEATRIINVAFLIYFITDTEVTLPNTWVLKENATYLVK